MGLNMSTGKPILSPTLEQHKLLNVREVMALLGVSRGTVYNYLASKNDPIPSVHLSGRKFQLDKILWWIEKRSK